MGDRRASKFRVGRVEGTQSLVANVDGGSLEESGTEAGSQAFLRPWPSRWI